MRPISVLGAALMVVALVAASPVHAQDATPPRHFSVNAGLFQFDLDGSGLAPMVAVRGATPISSVLIFEAAVLAARPEQRFGHSVFVVPEGQVQLALPFPSVNPYMGLGAGAVVDARGGGLGTAIDLTISGSLGVKAWFDSGLGAQFEYRARGVGIDFTGSSSEYTIGLIREI